jgi:hypothetical protein
MIILAHAAAALVALLGVLHLAYTLHDFGPRPRYFRPSDERLLEIMRAAKTAVAPNGRDYWSGVLGFNLSHSVGVMLFGLLIVIATLHAITWLKPLLIAIGATYGLISYRCWFIVPTVGILAATALLIVGWSM